MRKVMKDSQQKQNFKSEPEPQHEPEKYKPTKADYIEFEEIKNE